ncbi:unnamed protein product, partial [Ixodes hexagonus]
MKEGREVRLPRFPESLLGRRACAGTHPEPAGFGPSPGTGPVQPADAEKVRTLGTNAALQHVHADAGTQDAEQLTEVADESPGELVHLAADEADVHRLSGMPCKCHVPRAGAFYGGRGNSLRGCSQCSHSKVGRHCALSEKYGGVLGPREVRVVTSKQALCQRQRVLAAPAESVAEYEQDEQLEYRHGKQTEVGAVHTLPLRRTGLRPLVLGGRGNRAVVWAAIGVL